MTILYWITVLGNLYTLGRVLLIILLAVTCSIICGIGIYTLVNFPIIKQDEIRIKKAFNIVKKSLLYSILPLLIVIVVPSTKQLYAIYGVGTVIDYAKNGHYYFRRNTLRCKDKTTGEWYDAVLYSDVNGQYVREVNDFNAKFELCQ